MSETLLKYQIRIDVYFGNNERLFWLICVNAEIKEQFIISYTNTNLYSCISKDSYCSSSSVDGISHKLIVWLVKTIVFECFGCFEDRCSRDFSLCSVLERTAIQAPPPPTHTHTHTATLTPTIYSASLKIGNRDSILNLSKSERKIMKLLSVDDFSFLWYIGRSYWVRDGCSAIILVKHVKTVFVQVLSCM